MQDCVNYTTRHKTCLKQTPDDNSLALFFVFTSSKNNEFFVSLASDNSGQFYFSLTENPDKKILVCQVRKDHEVQTMEFHR